MQPYSGGSGARKPCLGFFVDIFSFEGLVMRCHSKAILLPATLAFPHS